MNAASIRILQQMTYKRPIPLGACVCHLLVYPNNGVGDLVEMNEMVGEGPFLHRHISLK